LRVTPGTVPQSDQLHGAFMTVARRQWGALAMADSTGQEVTYGRALVAAIALGRLIRDRTTGEQAVGLMVPASVGGALANLATLFAGRTPVNLNFTIGAESLDASIAQAGLRTILTSRVFLEKIDMPPRPGMVFLEDLRKAIGAAARLRALVEARVLPIDTLRRRYAAGPDRSRETLATIIFSSGSTGVPKGVMLTHGNVLANVESMAKIFPLGADDCFIGMLPFFHSFGYTGTMWFPLLLGCRIAFHPNPGDAKTIGELTQKYRGTMLISTPTFCQAYIRRCTREQFSTLHYAIVGAEKLRPQIAADFEAQFGLPLLEGYGCTEMSPVVSVNRPDAEAARDGLKGHKPGSVGHPIPDVEAKVVDQATGEGPLVERDGLLLLRGPNLMKGYLHDPERTKAALRDGWYVTGDIARIDADGFIFITDRPARFSKIAGEMDPHVRFEEAINAAIGEACCAVTSVPDDARGERLVAFYARRDVPPDQLWRALNDTDLPRLWLPRRDSLIPVDALPVLGTGKTDLRKLKEMAGAAPGVL
jgi:acyl-[acyl-carrier-protein]-phospholipid O-acyltransferase/long-chain-fatty-acid--[acyl-carrier-protein] ligase